MAEVYGAAGAYPKSEARRRLNIAIGAMLAVLMLYAFAFGYFLSNWPFLAWAAVAVVGGFLTWLALEQIEKRLKPLTDERLKFLRGGLAEELVGWQLEDLPDGWHVFHGIQLQRGSDLDHVIVGPAGLFYVQTKAHRGLFSDDGNGQMLYNGKPSNLLGQTIGQAMALKERLRALIGVEPAWLNTVLAVPFAYVEGKGQWRGVHVLHMHNLTETLAKFPKRLPDKEVDRYVKVVRLLAESAKAIRVDPATSTALSKVPQATAADSESRSI